MPTKRKLVGLISGIAAGIVVYYGLMWLLVWLVSDVFGISISTADGQSLFILVVLKLVPLACAMLTAILIVQRVGTRGRR